VAQPRGGAECARYSGPVTEPTADAAGVPSRTTLRWAVRLILAQVVALALLTAALGYGSLVDRSTTARMAASVTGYALLLTVLLGCAGVGLARHRRWARGPAIVLELLQVPIGFGLLAGGLAVVGVPMLAASIGAAGLLLAPSTRFALADR